MIIVHMRNLTDKQRRRSKPGRKSLQDWTGCVDSCLKHLDNPVRLRESPLVKMDAVRTVAERDYPSDPHGQVRALQDLVCRAVDYALPILQPRKREFLERYARGEPIAAIARMMKMNRSHLSRSYRPEVAEAVAVCLRSVVRHSPPISGTIRVSMPKGFGQA